MIVKTQANCIFTVIEIIKTTTHGYLNLSSL